MVKRASWSLATVDGNIVIVAIAVIAVIGVIVVIAINVVIVVTVDGHV